MFCPLSFSLWVFLSSQGIDVMWEQSSRLIRGVSQTTAGHPRLQAARRRGTTYVHTINNNLFNNKHLRPIQHISDSSVAWQWKTLWLPIFQVPTNTETTSGSLSWECLVFISWKSWQKASRFWRRRESNYEIWIFMRSYGKGKSGFQFLIKPIILPSYPHTFKRHLPRGVVVAVNHHAYLGRTALELDNLKDW